MIKRILLIILAPCFLVGQVYAITPQQQQSINTDTQFYDGSGAPGSYSCQTGGNGQVPLTGNDNEQKAYNYFVQQGLSSQQASGVVGNLLVESGVDPTILQKGGNSTNPNDAGTNVNNDGWGIAQWSPGGRITGIAQSLNVAGPIYDLGTQLQIVWLEMSGTSPTGVVNMLPGLKQINDVNTATEYFEQNFEEGGIAASGGGDLSLRQQDAQGVFQQYGSANSNSGSSSSSGCGGTTAACTSSANLASTGTSAATSNLSLVRQNVVCVAQQELALWSSEPGYPNTSYAATGLLKYTGGSLYEEWCADFASWVYNQAGDPLSTNANYGGPSWMLPGVIDIYDVGQPGQTPQNFVWHPASSGYTPQPGDLTIYSDYKHVNIFISSSGGVSTYIGGDQGNGPYGAPNATKIPPNPPSGSIVSSIVSPGYYSNGIIGYVSPN